MSEEAPLDEATQLQLSEHRLSGTNGAGIDVARPTAAGLQWLAVPSACVGLCYRIQGGATLEAIAFAPDPEVKLSLEISVPAVNLCCSADGRLIVAACTDGSLQCFDATSASLELRWILKDAHSHVTQDISQPVSRSREFAAAKAGPIHSLAFAPSGYAFLVADAGNQRLSIYNATSSEPTNLVENLMTMKGLCAAWSTEPSTDKDIYYFAAGAVDGSIEIMCVSLSTGSMMTKVSTIPAPDDEEMADFVPTHLDWLDNGKSLVSGYCRCSPYTNDDEQGEDDSADHDATLYVGSMDNHTYSNQTDLGEVVSFFSVPNHGRHVFFTSFAPANGDTPLLCVASNVANDVGVVALESGEWQVIELQEGFGAACPTDEDDEFTFPMGIATVRLPENSSTTEALLLASTDGSLSTFRMLNQNTPNAFCTPLTTVVHGVAALPATPVKKVVPSPPTPPLSSEPEETSAPAKATPVFGSGKSSGFSFGSGTAPSFGSPEFGKPSALGVGAAGSSVFGSPAADKASSASTPVFGSGSSVPVFGSFSPPGGGFAALATSPAATTATGFGSTSKDSPFGAFAKSDTGFAGASPMVKPLFGDGPPKPSEAKSQKIVLDEMASSEKETAETAQPEVAEAPAPESSDGDSDSLDTEGRKERVEEKKKAEDVFSSLATTAAGGEPAISKDDFAKLMEKMGTVYCEEEHRMTIKKLSKDDGMIYKDDFVAWYLDWLFFLEDDTSSEEEVADDNADEASPIRGAPSSSADGWGDIFSSQQEDTWKCDTCMVRNVASATVCASCETPKSGILTASAGGESTTTGSPGASGSSIGAGGFSFGGGSAQSGGFSFGSSPAPVAASAASTGEAPKPSASTIGQGGFTFGGGSAFSFGTSKVESTLLEDKAESSEKEKTETAPRDSANESVPESSAPGADKAARVFDSFDGEKAGTVPLDMLEEMMDELGEGMHGDEFDVQKALVDPEGTNKVSRSAFITWYVNLLAGGGSDDANDSLDTEDRKEWVEQKKKAEDVFSSLATTAAGGEPAIPKDDFAKLMEKMGTVYCEEEHRKTIKKLSKDDGMIYKDDFVAWYLDWLFFLEDDTSSEEEVADGNADEASFTRGAPSSSADGWGDIFSSQQEDTWKCDTCMVRNVASATVCASCETPKSGLTASAGGESTTTGSSGASGSSIGAGGFSFGGGSAPSGGFSFGSSPAPVAASAASSGEAPKPSASSIGGFSFGCGSAPSGELSFGSSPVPVAASAASTGEAPKPSASIGQGGFTFGGGSAFSFGTTMKAKNTSEEDKKDSSKTPVPSKSSGASSFPPMSLKAPTPFSAGNTNAAATTKSSGAAGYPPLPTKAPVPFEGGLSSSTASKHSASSSYPPISSKAPSPFSAGKTNAPASTQLGASSAYPPLSTKAPVPFGSGSSSGVTSKHSASSAFPPLSSNAPTPFSATKASAPAASKPGGTFAFPPLSSKAPTPFTGFKANTPAPSKSGGTSAFPPLSSKAPLPFGGGAFSAGASADTSVSTYPPITSKTPSPFSGSKTSARVPAKVGTSAFSDSSPWKKPASSDYESQFRKVVEKFEGSMSLLANNRLSSEFGFSAERDSNFESEIQKMMDEKDSFIASCDDINSQISEQKKRSIFLLSRKTDTKRQIMECRRLIDVQTRSREAQARIMETQPLDAESERCRRSLAVKALMVNRTLELLENRNSFLRGICDFNEENRADAGIPLAPEDRRNILFEEMTTTFQRTQVFKEEATRTSKRVVEYDESIPVILPSGLNSTPESQSRPSRKSLNGRTSKHRLTPISMGAPVSKTLSLPSAQRSDTEKWAKIEHAMRKTKVSAVPAKKLTRLARIGAVSTNVTSQNQSRIARSLGPSLLLSPTEGVPLSAVGKTVRQERLVFSSPLSKPRLDWNSGSNVDQEKMKGISLAFPQQLKKIDATEASRNALSGFGTTPEKAERALELKKSAGSFNMKSSSTTTARSSSVAAFPPMSSKAPTPFSADRTADRGDQAKASSSYPTMAKQAPSRMKPAKAGIEGSKPPLSLQPKASFSSFSRSPPIDEKQSVAKSRSPFGDLKGLGDSLFADDNKSSPAKSERDAIGLSLGAPLTDNDESNEPDYRKVLFDFYTTHNPAKLNEVEKTLEKYKVRFAGCLYFLPEHSYNKPSAFYREERWKCLAN